MASYATQCVRSLPASGTREIYTKATAMEAAGINIIHFEVGQPSFPSPKEASDATITSLKSNYTFYIQSDGNPTLREEISNSYTKRGIPTHISQIVVTAGSMMSMYSLFNTLLSPGDECLLPLPGYGNYFQAVTMSYGHAIPYLTTAEGEHLPTVDQLRCLITSKTKVLVICNPGNPTGAVYHKDLVKQIVQLTKDKGIYLISDEIYEDITFDRKHTCAAEFDDPITERESHIAVVSGVSKSYSMTGFRVGWTRCHPSMAMLLTKIQEPLISCGVPFAQMGALAAIQHSQEYIKMMTAEYKIRRDVALDILRRRGYPPTYIPEGSFYLLIDVTKSKLTSYEFSLKLLETKHCAVTSGKAYDTGLGFSYRTISSEERKCELDLLNSFIRLSLSWSTLDMISVGVELICDLLDELRQQ